MTIRWPSRIMPFSAFQRFYEKARRQRHRHLVAASTLFASDWYRLTYSKELTADTHPLDHYLAQGSNPEFSPSPQFDARDYLARYPDVTRAGLNPLVHYLTRGAAESRVFRPLGHHLSESGLFDPVWYRATYPDVSGANLTAHYLSHGARENRSPGPLFDAKDYLTRHPDVAASGINPLVHFLQFGAAEHRTAQSVANESPRDKRGPSSPIHLSHQTVDRPRIAVIVHVFYPDVFAVICSFLRNVPYRF